LKAKFFSLEDCRAFKRAHEQMNNYDPEEMHFKPRRVINQNIVWKLRQRETNVPRPGRHWHIGRSFTQNLFPNFTIVNVEKPPCFLRKFSPDGRYFVAFSLDQSSIEVYEFQGASAAEELLHGLAKEGSDPAAARRQLFGKFFKQTAVVTVARNGEHLNRECSLFTDDGRYVIVGSASYVPEDPHPYFFDIYRNNESVSPNPRSPLEDYTIHIVDLCNGCLSDSRSFKCDKIFLSHNQGLYLYRDLLAILSVQQQTVHIFQVTKEGKFIDVRSIGRFCQEDDELILTASLSAETENGHPPRPYRETCINGLKHRLMVHLYWCAEREDSPEAMRRFFQHFEQFRMLRMWKMQLLDETTLLIKYASEDVVTLRVADPNSQPSFFVLYNMESTQVLAIFENTSEKLLELFEQFCDSFRNAILHSPAQFTCSASSNIYARQIQRRFKHTIINAKYGGHTEAVKRLLAQLPISSQSYSSSPYLDLSLFSYDDKWVSVMERPKACGDHPIR
jgi:de-etiolated-1